MPPVGFLKTSGMRRIRFVSNLCYDGVDYGPDYEEQEADVAPNHAFEFVDQGRAVYVEETAAPPETVPTNELPPAASKGKK